MTDAQCRWITPLSVALFGSHADTVLSLRDPLFPLRPRGLTIPCLTVGFRLSSSQPSSFLSTVCSSLFVCVCGGVCAEMRSGSEIQSPARSNLSDETSTVLSPNCRIPYYYLSIILSSVGDWTRRGRGPRHLIPARVSLPGLRRNGRGLLAYIVDAYLLLYYYT